MHYKKILIVAALSLSFILPPQTGEAAKLLCLSREDLKGEETVGTCVAKGDEFAIVDDAGFVRILTPREIALTKLFNPQVLEQRAYGLKYRDKAPEINILKRRAVMGGPGQ
jgi:hypothetical protein